MTCLLDFDKYLSPQTVCFDFEFFLSFDFGLLSRLSKFTEFWEKGHSKFGEAGLTLSFEV
jgi:hypothetical protein